MALLAVLLSGCYVTAQALHQNDLFNTRRRVEDVIADPETAPKTKAQLESVQRILKYAQEQGLRAEGAYGYYIETSEPVVSYIVQAAYADRLEFVTWWFPVVGDVPYLGFFKKGERDAKAHDLEAAGYDVHRSGAGAFSSLGWFDDPIFSSMLRRSEADLAHLFFHELTHRTLWVPGSSEFNENLAEYVAGVITPMYLKDSGHADLIQRYKDKHADAELFRDWLLKLQDTLEELYDQADKLPKDELMKRKRAIFDRFTHPPDKPAFKAVDYIADEDWNNASLLGASMYAPDEARFGRAYRCVPNPSVRTFLAALAAASTAAPDGFSALDSLCH